MSGTIPVATVNEGTRRIDFYNDTTFREWALLTVTHPPTPLSSYLDEFRNYPQVNDVLITYFDECLKSIDNKLRLGPSILIGCISELLILRLVETIGEYLEDTNALSNYYRKKTMTAKHSYTIEMVRLGRQKLEDSIDLTEEQIGIFTEFNNIVNHLFDSIRLRRNEYVHPRPNMTLDDLPAENVIAVHVHGFNLYAKIILNLISIFKQMIQHSE